MHLGKVKKIALQQHRSNRIDRQAFYELLQYRIGTKTLFTSSDKLIDTSHIDLFRLTQHHQSVWQDSSKML